MTLITSKVRSYADDELMKRGGKQRTVRLDRTLLHCFVLLSSMGTAAQAQDTDIEADHVASCQPDDCALFQIDDRILATLPYPSQYRAADRRENETRPISYYALPQRPAATAAEQRYAFSDEEYWLIRLAQMDELRLKTLWENQSSSLYLGIDSSGFAGFIVGQKKNSQDGWPSPKNHGAANSGSNSPTVRAIGPGARPLVHGQSLTYQQPDLSNIDNHTQPKTQKLDP